jgi:hypothetical protein
MAQIFRIDPALLARPYAAEIAAIRPTVAQLVDRYGLAGKSILSIGPGVGLEEMAMLECGAGSMTMFDVDESGTLAGFLPTIARPDGTVTYMLGDFTKIADQPLPRCDVLYVSSLTPDEHHRASTLRRPPSWLCPPLRPSWPRNAPTLHPSVVSAMQRYVAPDGIFILQSYAAGIDVSVNHYLEAWSTTLRAVGFELLEAYRFTVSPATTLWVAARDKITFDDRPALTRFHGRSELGVAGVVRFI